MRCFQITAEEGTGEEQGEEEEDGRGRGDNRSGLQKSGTGLRSASSPSGSAAQPPVTTRQLWREIIQFHLRSSRRSVRRWGRTLGERGRELLLLRAPHPDTLVPLHHWTQKSHLAQTAAITHRPVLVENNSVSTLILFHSFTFSR